MIRLFCQTSGWSNDFISKVISFFDKPIKLPNYKGVLGDLSEKELKEITQTLETNGFYLFKQKLPADVIDRLYNFSLREQCFARRLDNEDVNAPAIKIHYDPNNPISTVYDVVSEATNSNADIQAMLRDHSILAVAQSYLRTSPKVEPISLTWSAAFGDKPQVNSAQLYHFDMDRFKWLKFFIFLTDVTIETGPHCFIRKSHQSGAIPQQLLKSGYVRHSDEEVLKHYPKEDIITFTAPAGTIIAEDTRGLHKGTHLIKGDRLLLQLQFSNSLFGCVLPSLKEAKIDDKELIEFARKNKKIFALFPALGA
jgi:hypothetical protein